MLLEPSPRGSTQLRFLPNVTDEVRGPTRNDGGLSMPSAVSGGGSGRGLAMTRGKSANSGSPHYWPVFPLVIARSQPRTVPSYQGLFPLVSLELFPAIKVFFRSSLRGAGLFGVATKQPRPPTITERGSSRRRPGRAGPLTGRARTWPACELPGSCSPGPRESNRARLHRRGSG